MRKTMACAMATTTAAMAPAAATTTTRYTLVADADAAALEGGFEAGGFDKEASVAYEFLRAGFVRKVFALLATQLLVTAIIAAPIVLHEPTRAFVAASPGLLMLSALGSLAIVMVLSFSEEARHKHPTNLVLLGAFTILEAVGVGAVAASYSLPSVALAVAATAVSVGALSAYAARAKTDYTLKGGMLVSALTALLFTMLVGAFAQSRAFEVAVSGAAALLFSAFLVADLQMVMGGAGWGGAGWGVGGGRRAASAGARAQPRGFLLGPDDYVAAAIQLYLDVLNLFLHLLRILGTERDGG